eukprot:SM000019S05018  [mRNA]  locus=s19:585876:587446:+ [translate_table: standard]
MAAEALAQMVATTMAAGAATGAASFDFFYFVQQWPGSYCDGNRKCCYNPDKGKPKESSPSTVYGPTTQTAAGPTTVMTAGALTYPSLPSIIFQISDLEDDLETYWDTLHCPASKGESFWSHEWSKHGTCADTLGDEHAYFNAALQLWNSTLITQALADAGITPGASYNFRDIMDIITNYVGFKPAIECNNDREKRPQLYQVYICVDADGETLIDCPIYPKVRACPKTVAFPLF